MIKFCPKCYENHINKMGCYNGYYWCLKDDVKNCWIDGCNYKLIDIDFPASDLKVLTEVSSDPSLYRAMIELHDKDIIEYELKMSQFRNQVNQKQMEKVDQSNNRPKCPTCGSTNIEKISIGKKAKGSFLFGVFSSDVRNTMCCNSCGYKW